MVTPSDVKNWLSSMARRRVTATDIADILGVSRTTVNSRLKQGLSSDDLITICRHLHINPTDALVELHHLDYNEVTRFMDMDGRRIDTADDGELALELARRLNPATKAPEIDELAQRREQKTVEDFDFHETFDPALYAADSSPDETEERLNRGEDPID